MRIRNAGPAHRIGMAVLLFALGFLACSAAMASDVERRIPLTRDAAGSGLTMEISRDGTRQTATPFLTLHEPTVRRIEERIGKYAARYAPEVSGGAAAADSVSRAVLTGTPPEGSGRPETARSSPPPASGEITLRSVGGLLKRLRASRKEKPVPAAVVAAPEQRLGMADTSLR